MGYHASQHLTMVPAVDNLVPLVPRRVGSGQVVPGLDEGLLTMRPGGVRRLYIPGEPPSTRLAHMGQSDGSSSAQCTPSF